MKKLTPEDIKFIILEKTENEQGHFATETQLEQYGKIILDVLFPPLKPLNALVGAEHDCHKIYEFAIGKKCSQILISKESIQMQAKGEVGSTLIIHYNGFIRASQMFHVKRGNHFALIDFIRKLGYQPNSELL